MPLTPYFTEIVVATNNALERHIPSAETHPTTIHQAMRYSLFAGGKRLRPLLAIAACDTIGGDRANVWPFAAALEMIHTYTLIHDDLPALDNDDLRRGKKTCHRQFSESTAILAGDGLLTHAAHIMTDTGRYATASAETLLRVAAETTHAIGTEGTIGGQVVDIEMENREGDLAALEYIHTHKTGKLIVAALRGGALLAGGEEDHLAAITHYGQNIGLAFQVMDDILDIEGNEKKLGKPVGSDAGLNKLTYPTLMGMSDSKKLAARLTDRAIDALDMFGDKGNHLRDLAQYIIARSF